jgi:hypothetical protein
MKRFLITIGVLVLIFKVGLGQSWTDTACGIILIGFILFIFQAVADFGKDVGRAMSREQTNFNFTQNVTEEHKLEDQTQGPLHPDFTRPDSAREAYPAVITVRHERNKP